MRSDKSTAYAAVPGLLNEVPAGSKGWLVIFHRHSTWWVEAICPGRFKHVSLAGFVPGGPDVWLVVSWELARLRVGVVADVDMTTWLPQWMGPGGAILQARAPDFDFGRWRPRAGFFCASAAAHVLGLPCGALLPISLYRLLLRQGAKIIRDAPESLSAPADGDRESSGRGSRARAA